MHVRVVITVEMDDEAVADWYKAFGTAQSKREVARDVKDYIGNEAQQAGVFGSGEVSADITWK
jgi:hypothetical protein